MFHILSNNTKIVNTYCSIKKGSYNKIVIYLVFFILFCYAIDDMYQDYLLLQHLPAVRRARGGYLYTEQGHRLIDLWLQNGHLFNGHHPQTLLNAVKNSLSRTFIAEYPNIWHEKVLHRYTQYFQAKKVIIASLNSNLEFNEPWSHNAQGCYLLRASYPIPANITTGKIILPLHNHAIYLYFTEIQTTNTLQSVILPAYLAQIALKLLPFFAQSSSTLPPLNTNLFVHHQHYFQWHCDSQKYQTYFLEALQQNILLPPHHQATGLWLPELFSEKQNSLIKEILT